MKTIFSVALFLCFTTGLMYAQQPDQSTPQGVMDAMIQAAKMKDPSWLKGLCPPDQSNDGDTDCICALYGNYKPHNCNGDQKEEGAELTWDIYVEYFSQASVVKIELYDEEHAIAQFTFGPDGSIKEAVKLVHINDKWYILAF